MASYFVKRSILNVVSKYIHDDFKLDINLFSSGNTVELENVRLRDDCIPSSLPVKLVCGHLGRVVVQLPLFHLSSKPTHVYADEVSIVLVLKEENDVSREDLFERLVTLKTRVRLSVERMFRESAQVGFDDDSESNGEEEQDDEDNKSFEFPKLPHFVRNLLKNFRVHVGNIHIRFELYTKPVESFCLKGKTYNASPRCNAIGMCLQDFELDNLGDVLRYLKSSDPFVNAPDDEASKFFRISRLGCYIDVDAPRTMCPADAIGDKSRSRMLPNPLVSYENHTWVIEPLTLVIRLHVDSWFPSRGQVWRPVVYIRALLSGLKLNVHPATFQVLLTTAKELKNWHAKLDHKVLLLDAQNSKTTMSVSEHAQRCDLYAAHYLKTLGLMADPHSKPKYKLRAIKLLQVLEKSVHIEDLVTLWPKMLSELKTNTGAFVSTAKRHIGHRIVEKGEKMHKPHENVENQSSIMSTTTSPSVSRENFIRMLTVSQIYDGKQEETSEDDTDTGILSSMIQPKFDITLSIDNIVGHVSTSRQSASMFLFNMEKTYIGLRNFEKSSTSPLVVSASFVLFRVLEARGLGDHGIGSPYVIMSHTQTFRTKHSAPTGKNPVWNEAFLLDPWEGKKDFLITLWIKKDIGKDVMAGQCSYACRYEDMANADIHDWLSLGPGNGFLRVAVARSSLHSLPRGRFETNRNLERAKWPNRNPITVEMYLGDIVVKSGATNSNSKKPTYVNIVHLEAGSHVFLFLHQKEFSRFLAYNMVNPVQKCDPFHSNLFLELAACHILVSRWQILFMLSSFSDSYIAPLYQMLTECEKDEFGEYIEQIRERSTGSLTNMFVEMGVLEAGKLPTHLGAFHLVTDTALPVILVCNIRLCQIDVGFTWGSGSGEITQDAGRVGQTDHIVSHVVLTNANVFVGSHVVDPSNENVSGFRIELCVGSIGIIDDSAPHRPVVYAHGHRNTDFISQGSNDNPPILKVKIFLPFFWAFHLNFNDRRAKAIPERVNSDLKIDVSFERLVVEAPAIFFVILPIIGGIMPLTKLITIPPLPSIAINSIVLNVFLKDFRCVAMETLDPQYGSRAIAMKFSLHSGFQSFAHQVNDVLIADLSFDIGVCTLLEGRAKDQISATKKLNSCHFNKEFESVAHACASHFRKNTRPFWKETHKILVDFSLDCELDIKSGAKPSHAKISFSVAAKPFEVFLWLDDLAIIFRILTSFLNDAVYLTDSFTDMVGFELPVFAWTTVPSEDLENDEDLTQNSVLRSYVSSEVKSSINDRVRARSAALLSSVQLPLTLQDILLLDYRVSSFDHIEYGIADDPKVDLRLIIGHSDFPLCRMHSALDWRFSKNVLEVDIDMDVWYYNRKFSDWEPIVEPWESKLQVVFESDEGEFLSLKGVSFSSDEILEVDLTQLVMKEFMMFALEGTRMLDHTDVFHSSTFYPRIDQPVYKQVQQYELCNFTGESILFQIKWAPVKVMFSEAEQRDDQLNCETSWSLAGDFSSLGVNEVCDIEFDEESLRTSSDNAGRLYIKICFERYDQSCEAYLIRVDRIGDFAIALGNGIILRISIGTKDGYRKSVMLLSAVSLVNHTKEDLVLSRDQGTSMPSLHQVLSVNSTLFVPVAMTDSKLSFKYLVHSKQDFAYTQNGETRFYNTCPETSENILDLSLDKMPSVGESAEWIGILSSKNMLCAVQASILDLNSMAFNNYHETGGDTELVSAGRKAVKALRPKWSRKLKEMDEAKSSMLKWKASCMRAIQVVLKPLLSFDNALPVPLLILPVKFDGSLGHAEGIAAGANLVLHDRNANAIQLKIPSEDSEWSVPIPIFIMANPKLRALLLRADPRYTDFMSTAVEENVAFSKSTFLSLYGGHLHEFSKMEAMRETDNHLEAMTDLLQQMNRVPLARRINSINAASYCMPTDHWMSARVIAVSQLEVNSGTTRKRRVTLMFRNRILGTHPVAGLFTKSSLIALFEQTLSFMFPFSSCSKSLINKWLYIQYVEVHEASPSRVIGAGKIDLSHLMFDFYTRGGSGIVRRICREVTLYALNGNHLDESRIIGTMDFDIRLLPNTGNLEKKATPSKEEMNDQSIGDIRNYLSDNEPGKTDHDEFEIVSALSDREEFEDSSGDEEIFVDEGSKVARERWSKLRVTAKLLAKAPLPELLEQEEENFTVTYTDSMLATGHLVAEIKSFDLWRTVARIHDSCKLPCYLNYEFTSDCSESGFKVTWSPQRWIVNETSMPLIIQQVDGGQLGVQMVPPTRVSLFNDLVTHGRLAFKEPSSKNISSVNLIAPAETTASIDFNFKGEEGGRAVAWQESFSLTEKQSKVTNVNGLTISHQIYMANRTQYSIEVKQVESRRRLGKMQLEPFLDTFLPYQFKASEFQFRLRRQHKGENEMSSDWSGVINLKSSSFSSKHSNVPVAVYDTDGDFVDCIQVEVYFSRETTHKGIVTSLLTSSQVRTCLIRFRPDDPPTYIITNNSGRVLIVDQLESGENSSFELTVQPKDRNLFGWALPSDDHKRIRVKMILKPEEKASAKSTEDLNLTFDMEKVGKTKTVGIGEYRIYAKVEISHSTRQLVVTCEKSDVMNDSVLLIQDPKSMGNMGNIDDPLSTAQFVVCVRVLQLRKVVEDIVALPFVRIRCGGEEKLTNQGTKDENNVVSWSDAPIYFQFDVVKPRYIDFDVITPVTDTQGAVSDGIVGKYRIEIYDRFEEEEGIHRIPTQIVRLRNGSLPSFRKVELQFETYLITGPTGRNADARSSHVVRLSLPGLGISIINERKKQEDLYCRVSGIGIHLKWMEGRLNAGRLNATMRIRKIQIDNYQPHVQDRVCIVPLESDVPVLEINAIVNQANIYLLGIESLQVLVQSFMLKIDENFLDAVFGLVHPILAHMEDVTSGVTKALRLVYGGFEGKRTVRYPMEEDLLTGETYFIVSDTRQDVVSHSVEHSKEVLRPSVQREIPSRIFKVYLKEAHIYPVHVIVSFFFNMGEGGTLGQYQKGVWFKGVISGLSKWSEVSFRISEYHDNDSYGTISQVTKELRRKLIKEAGLQSWKGIAALNILGNPQAFVERTLGSIVNFCVSLPTEFRRNGIGSGVSAAADSAGHMVCVFVSAPVEFAGRITGSCATILEGTRPVRHLGKPLRLITTSLEFIVQGTDFLDPLRVTHFQIRKSRKFEADHVFQPIPKEPKKETVIIPVLDETPEIDESVVIDIFDESAEGITEEGKERNRRSQFHINHQLHCCLLCVPGLNFVWIFIYALHVIGVLQWF